MEWLLKIDYSLLLLINGFHTAFLDLTMIVFSDKYVWIPLYAIVTFYIFYHFGYKQKNYRYALLLFAGAILTFAITDVGSNAIKHYFMRLRPGHDPALEGVIRLLDGKGGLYGFISSHAANVFGFALFTSHSLKRKWYSITIFTWAFLVSYSRMYVGRHFPSDVICGAIYGIIVAWLIYTIIQSRIINNLLKTKY